jgi:hypothetical protein
MNPRGVIIIKSGNSVPRAVRRKDGTQVIFNEQKAAIDAGDDFPTPFTINLQDGQQAFAPGRYLLDPACLQVGDFDSLRIGRRIELIPLPAAK